MIDMYNCLKISIKVSLMMLVYWARFKSIYLSELCYCLFYDRLNTFVWVFYKTFKVYMKSGFFIISYLANIK